MSYTSKGIAYTYVIQKAGTSAMAHMTVWADKRDLALAKAKRMLAGSNLVLVGEWKGNQRISVPTGYPSSPEPK
jgi:hypothetical protein